MGLMILHRMALLCLCFSVVGVAAGHGGVVEEDDICLMKVDYLRAHFKIYQPQVSGHEQFCEDLPAAAESIFIMEYEHESLATMPIDFRIVRNVTGKGRFARMADVERIDDLEAATVFYRDPVVEPHVYTVLHVFEETGDFIGIVSARHPETGQTYAAVFPFEVGFTGLGYWPVIIGIVLLLQIHYALMSGRLTSWLGRNKPAAIAAALLLCCLSPAVADELLVTWESPEGPIRINTMHHWILTLETPDGRRIEDAQIRVSGGMPEHDHGLPTTPRVTANLGNGRYRLDGLRFHMRGYWEIDLDVTTADGRVTVTLPLQL